MAKAKNNKLSVNTLDDVFKSINNQTTIVWNGIEIDVQKQVSLATMKKIIGIVSGSCFSEDGGYMPENVDIAFRIAVIDAYTNITLPSNTEKVYLLLYGTDLYDTIIDNVNHLQIDEMEYSIDKVISFIVRSNIDNAAKKVDEMYRAIEEFGNNLSNVFDGLDTDELRSIVKSIADNGVDERKIVEAYLDKKQ